MPTTRSRAPDQQQVNKVGSFFLATLVLWLVSVWFEILVNKRWELGWVVGGACFYQFANWSVRLMVSRDPLFVNTSVSLLHSSITSLSVVSILVNQYLKIGSNQMLEHAQLVEGTWEWAYPALCFSCGYFAYDQLDMLHYGLYSGLIPSILVHHLILLVCFTLALFRNVTINYLILTLICENPVMCMNNDFVVEHLIWCFVSASIFLHVRKLRRMAGVRDAKSLIVQLEWFLNWTAFIFARTVSHILITIKLITDAPKFGKGVEWPLALFGMVGMNLINIGLGIDLFNAFRRERKPQHSSHHRSE